VKKGFTIFLLALFLLNVLGYYGIFLGLEFKNEKEMKALFDDDNSILQQAEITIKVPVTVPYATNSTEFTRVDGEFEHEGEVFRMVKQRVISDTLYIVCVKDDQSKDIKQALTQYVKSFTDKPVSEKGSSKTVQNFIKDYISSVISLQSKVIGWNKSLSYGENLLVYESLAIQLNSPPPRA
jgi:hypothetical protein